MAERPQLVSVNFKKDMYITVEGKQDAGCFFILRQGKVQLSKTTEVVKEAGSSLLGPGDFFGVVSSLSSHSHIETAQALTDVSLISVHRNHFEGLIQYNTSLAMKIILQFSQRLRYLNKALTLLTLKHIIEEDGASQLFKIGEYYYKKTLYPQAYYGYQQYLTYYPKGEYVERAQERRVKLAPYGQLTIDGAGETEFNRTYAKESILFAEGEPGAELFIIQSGAVKIIKIVDDAEVILAVLKKGDIFGEMALLESKPRSASAIAYEDCTVTTVKKANFEGFTASQPQIIARLTQLLAERIWFIHKQLANTLIQDPVGRMYDGMLMHLEKNRVALEPKTGYTFSFGPQELANMVGIPPEEAPKFIDNILENQKIQVVDNKIRIMDVTEALKQSEYYRKMQQRENARRESARSMPGSLR
ncbi:MAG: Crp/Fnr family transcriptional regulator [Treponema sp.]|jgi:CRP-like cAMP-binding protein|nr:Crp/Fnr family transcriptional regulator [Treponema sp.]